MTREEAKEVFLNRGFIDGIYDGNKWREACIVISKWLEQEPILDELRAEITTLQNRCYALTKGTMCAFCKYECEYKAESEPQESEG